MRIRCSPRSKRVAVSYCELARMSTIDFEPSCRTDGQHSFRHTDRMRMRPSSPSSLGPTPSHAPKHTSSTSFMFTARPIAPARATTQFQSFGVILRRLRRHAHARKSRSRVRMFVRHAATRARPKPRGLSPKKRGAQGEHLCRSALPVVCARLLSSVGCLSSCIIAGHIPECLSLWPT